MAEYCISGTNCYNSAVILTALINMLIDYDFGFLGPIFYMPIA